ncbi:MAG: hypothetical protein WCV85_06870 [Patescibacteria group bacterium]
MDFLFLYWKDVLLFVVFTVIFMLFALVWNADNPVLDDKEERRSFLLWHFVGAIIIAGMLTGWLSSMKKVEPKPPAHAETLTLEIWGLFYSRPTFAISLPRGLPACATAATGLYVAGKCSLRYANRICSSSTSSPDYSFSFWFWPWLPPS